MDLQQSPVGRSRDRVEQFEAVVVGVRVESSGVVSVELARPDGSPMPAWEPGAHATFHLRPGLDREYSLCGPADRADVWQVAVLREPESRGGSAFVHAELKAGDRVEVTGPRNGFPLVDGQDEYLLIAGGIGITPILAMARELERRGARWRLMYGGRTRDSMAFLDELEANDRVLVRPEAEHGLLDLAGFVGEPRPGTVVYCCGPEPLLKAVERQCEDWPAGALNIERFRADAEALSQAGGAFEIELADSNLTLTVADGQSIVEVLEGAGISVMTSCREGTCGTCETPVLEGIPDHRDSFLSDEEKEDNTTMMVCVGRSLTPRLVLEL